MNKKFHRFSRRQFAAGSGAVVEVFFSLRSKPWPTLTTENLFLLFVQQAERVSLTVF